MYGVVDKLYICNINRTNELNNRMSLRNIPSQALEPQYGIRPVSTKYTTMQILDQRAQPQMPLPKFATYDAETVFNPGTAQAPWSGFSENINTESELRNQFFALQKFEQSYYVPRSSSDLYNAYVPPMHAAVHVEQPHPNLFSAYSNNGDSGIHQDCNTPSFTNNKFNNYTRNDVKNVSDDHLKK